MLFLAWWIIMPSVEGFNGLPLRSKLHIIVDRNSNPISWNYQQPSGDGIYGCTQTSCPDTFPDDAVCWCCCNYH